MRRNYSTLKKAFDLMRDHQILAKRNLGCCQACAGYHLTTAAVRAVDKGETVNGCCYYTRQDQRSITDSGVGYLGFGGIDTEEGRIGLPDKAVGDMVTTCLATAGVQYEWDGDPNKRIKVFVPEVGGA